MVRRCFIVALTAFAALLYANSAGAKGPRPSWLCSPHAPGCGTVHVEVTLQGGLKRYAGAPRPEPSFPVQITRLPPGSRSRTTHTSSHTIRLKPGAYRIAAATHSSTRVKVTVSPGEIQEVTVAAIVH